MSLTILNDCHNGVVRAGGTTPKTAWGLRRYVLDQFDRLLSEINTDLLILGDLLDTHMIPYMDLFSVFSMLQSWLRNTPDKVLYLVPGNHDLSKTTTTMSSFQFLCKLLSAEKNVVVVDQPMGFDTNGVAGYVIPHLPNQDLFNLALSKVPPVKYLFLHCNFDNKFAQEADHSLNLSSEQAAKLPVERIIIAHEHQRKVSMDGKVILPGNQTPSSVADCLGNDVKYMLRIQPDAIEYLPTWTAKGSFERVNWRECMNAQPDSQFIRVEGEASSAESTSVISAISKLRSVHGAFVITNSVAIEGRVMDGERLTLEKAKSFNILEAVLGKLKPEQAAIVKRLLEDHVNVE